MRPLAVVVLIASLGGAAAALAAEKTPPEGFTALFNGKDLTSWHCKGRKADYTAKHWNVQDGVIKYDGKAPDLWTTKSFRDFVLMVDWRLPRRGDSGIFLRGQSKSQVNIWCSPMGSGEVWGYRTDRKLPEEIRKACTPSKRADNKVGEWNTFVITMKADRLTVVLNGEKVIDNAQLPGIPIEGPIALQRHGDPVDFKNIYIKELKPEKPKGAAEPVRVVPQ